MARHTRPEPAPILVSRDVAARTLGMVELDHFERHVQPFIFVRPSGRLALIPVVELERWAREGQYRVRSDEP